MIESDYLYISLAIVFQGILVPQTWISDALSPSLPSNIYLVPYFSNVCGSVWNLLVWVPLQATLNVPLKKTWRRHWASIFQQGN